MHLFISFELTYASVQVVTGFAVDAQVQWNSQQEALSVLGQLFFCFLKLLPGPLGVHFYGQLFDYFSFFF